MSKLTNINTDLTGRILHPTDVNYDNKRYMYAISIPEGKYAVAYYDINELAKIGKHLSFIVKAPGSNATSTSTRSIQSFGIEQLIRSVSDKGIKRASPRANVLSDVNYIEFTSEMYCLGNNSFGTAYDYLITHVGIAHIKTANGSDTKTVSAMMPDMKPDTIESYGIKYTGMSFNCSTNGVIIISQIPLKIQIIDSIDNL